MLIVFFRLPLFHCFHWYSLLFSRMSTDYLNPLSYSSALNNMFILWSRCEFIISHQRFISFSLNYNVSMFNGPELYVMVIITTETNNLLPDFFHCGPWTVIFFYVSSSLLQTVFGSICFIHSFVLMLFNFHYYMNSCWLMWFVSLNTKKK